MEFPHERCNYLDDTKLILLGAFPRHCDIESILSSGVTAFINLTHPTNAQCSSYEHLLPLHVRHYNVPIRSGRPPSMKQMRQIVEIIKEHIKQNNRIYIHCVGGHGRTSVVGAIWFGLQHSLDACDAIEHVKACRNTRQDTSKNYIPIPETNAQVKFIAKWLGLHSHHVLPDRSDMSWLKSKRFAQNL